MTNRDIIDAQISNVKKYLSAAEHFQGYSQAELTDDFQRRLACERILYLVAQATIDLAESVVNYKSLRKPAKLSESFVILHENNLVDADVTGKMVAMVGFRNALAHDYDQFDYGIMYSVVQTGLHDIEEFLSAVRRVIV